MKQQQTLIINKYFFKKARKSLDCGAVVIMGVEPGPGDWGLDGWLGSEPVL